MSLPRANVFPFEHIHGSGIHESWGSSKLYFQFLEGFTLLISVAKLTRFDHQYAGDALLNTTPPSFLFFELFDDNWDDTILHEVLIYISLIISDVEYF